MSESDYYLAFLLSPTIGPKRFLRLISHFSTAKNAWSGSEDEYAEAGVTGSVYKKFNDFRISFSFSHYSHVMSMKKNGIVFISQKNKHYPQQLLDLGNPPIGLFCKGNLHCLDTKNSVAIVGSRKITSYGGDVTKMFADYLAALGVTIVSGMALGVDAIAHASAIESKGKTIAVLGNGVDKPYPRENMNLYGKILESGGLIISEYPPGMMAVKGSFPARNRIIAALSQGVIVTEAGTKSGSLITAEEAQKLRRVVFAVPGPITSEQSEGTGYLLKNGAILVMKPQDIAEHLGMNITSGGNTVDIASLGLDVHSSMLLTLLHHEAHSLDFLSKKMSLPISDVSRIVTRLELQGYVKNNGQGIIIAVM